MLAVVVVSNLSLSVAALAADAGENSLRDGAAAAGFQSMLLLQYDTPRLWFVSLTHTEHNELTYNMAAPSVWN
jgi:hypothetical protein